MSKEIGRLLQTGSIEFNAYWLDHGETRLKPEGRKDFREVVRLVKEGKKIMASEHIQILSGFRFSQEGLENLDSLNNNGILVIGNHSTEGPLRGWGNTLLTTYYVKQASDKEIRWVHGRDITTTQELSRKSLEQVFDTIPVREGKIEGIRQIIDTFKHQGAVGLYPEGDGSKILQRANPRAGGIILLAARNNASIVCATTSFKDETLSITFTDPLDNSKIISLGEGLRQKGLKREDQYEIQQQIADYGMQILAQNLPENRRGYYGESQKTNDVELLNLTTHSMILTPDRDVERIIRE